MSKEAKKPAGWRAFNALARKLVRVSKDDLDAKRAARKPKKRKSTNKCPKID